MNDTTLYEGYISAVKNAQALQIEGTFLKENGFLSRSYCLFQLSIEEVGKALILSHCIMNILSGEIVEEKDLKKLGFFDHKAKSIRSLQIELRAIIMFEKHLGKKTELRQYLIDEYKSIEQINNLKNSSLYVGIVDGRFVVPENVITKELLNEMEKRAIIRNKALEPVHSLEEIHKIVKEINEMKNDPDRFKQFEADLDTLTRGID